MPATFQALISLRVTPKAQQPKSQHFHRCVERRKGRSTRERTGSISTNTRNRDTRGFGGYPTKREERKRNSLPLTSFSTPWDALRFSAPHLSRGSSPSTSATRRGIRVLITVTTTMSRGGASNRTALELARPLKMPFVRVFISPDSARCVVRDAFEGGAVLLKQVKPLPQ